MDELILRACYWSILKERMDANERYSKAHVAAIKGIYDLVPVLRDATEEKRQRLYEMAVIELAEIGEEIPKEKVN